MNGPLIRRILVVDDEEQYRTMVGQCLRWMGYECEIAKDAPAALKLLSDKAFDLVISDIRMKGKDGLQLTREARLAYPYLEFIIMTGFAADYSYSNIIEAGAADFIAKPFTSGELRAKIERVEREKQILRRLNETNTALLREVVVNSYLAELSRSLIADLPIEDMSRLVLSNAMRLTDSPVGCIGSVRGDSGRMVCLGTDAHHAGDGSDSVHEIFDERLEAFLQNQAQMSETEAFMSNACAIEVPGRSEDASFHLRRCILTPASVDSALFERLMVANAERDYTTEDVRTVERLADIYALAAHRKNVQEELGQAHSQLARALNATVNALATTLEMRDPYTAGHQRRVSKLACAIANELHFPRESIETIRMAGLIHDIGKIGVPSEILSKPSFLKEVEMGLIRHHSQTGYDILKEVDFPQPIAQIVLQHHERMNGRGYPMGLSSGEILVEARIVAVADVVEAMSSHRPYRPALGVEMAMDEISRNRGTMYDADAVGACLDLLTTKHFTFD